MDWSLIGSLTLNVVLLGTVVKLSYDRVLKVVVNRSIDSGVRELVNLAIDRYVDASAVPSGRVGQLNAALRQVFPDLMLPEAVNEARPHIAGLAEYTVNVIDPADIYYRYQTTALDMELRTWLTSVESRARDYDLHRLVNTVIPNLVRELSTGAPPLERYMVSCQYQHMSNIMTANIDLDEEQVETADDIDVAVCSCGQVWLAIDRDVCSQCGNREFQRVVYPAFFDIKEHLAPQLLTSCPITLTEFSPDTQIGILSCGHYAERGPLLNWIQNTRTCHYARCQLRPLIRPRRLNVDLDNETSVSLD